jgi:hypothetical protein
LSATRRRSPTEWYATLTRLPTAMLVGITVVVVTTKATARPWSRVRMAIEVLPREMTVPVATS